jgi:hypothetical protein
VKLIRLGIIGLSNGNGHPYSWSAIINGYKKKEMKNCGFSAIPEYLNKQSWPKNFIKNAKVTHIWTQNLNLSKKIASTTFIPKVEKNLEGMIGKVDGILLARDDFKNHFEMAKPFLDSGLPVYIDKPIATSKKDLYKIYNLERYPGQIFTCSATRYSKDLSLTKINRKKVGKIKKIIAITPKSWEKYGVHIIEPVIKLLNRNDILIKCIKHSNKNLRNFSILWKSKILTTFVATNKNNGKISITVIGSKNTKNLIFNDVFVSFKAALKDFIYGIKKKSIQSKKNFNIKVVNIIEKGIKIYE